MTYYITYRDEICEGTSPAVFDEKTEAPVDASHGKTHSQNYRY